MRYEQNHILPQKTGTRVYGIVKGFQKVYLLKPLIFTLFYLCVKYKNKIRKKILRKGGFGRPFSLKTLLSFIFKHN